MKRKEFVTGAALIMALAVSGCGAGSNVPGETVSENTNNDNSVSEESDTSGANQKAAGEDIKNNDTSDDSSENEGDAASQNQKTADDLNGMFSIAHKNIQATYDGEKKFTDPDNDMSKGVLYNNRYAVLMMSDESADVFPNLYKTINELAKNKIADTDRLANEAKEMAKSDYEEAIDNNYGFIGPYNYDEDIRITRADENYLSIITSIDEFYGGFHNLYTEHGCTYDVATGEEVRLDEIVKCSEDELNKLLSEELHAIEYDEDQFLYLEENLAEYKYEPTASDAENNENPERAYNWYLAGDGLHFIFNPYELAAYVYGASDVVIGYDEYDGVLDDKFRPNTDTGYITPERIFIGSDENYENGLSLRFLADGSYQDGYTPAKGLVLTIDDNSATIEKQFKLIDDYVNYYRVHKKDGTEFIYVVLPEPDDCYDLFVYEITGNTPKAVRAGTYKRNAETIENGYMAYRVFTNPEKEYDEQLGDTEVELSDIVNDNSASDSESDSDQENASSDKTELEDGNYSTNLTTDPTYFNQYITSVEFTEDGIIIEGSLAKVEDDYFTLTDLDYGTYFISTDASTEYITGGGEENNYISRGEFKEHLENLLDSGLGLSFEIKNGTTVSIGIYS